MRRLVALILFLLTALAVGGGSQLAAAGPIGTFSRGYSGVAAPGYVYDVALKQSIQTVGIAEDSPPPAPPPTSTRGGALPRIHFHAVAAENAPDIRSEEHTSELQSPTYLSSLPAHSFFRPGKNPAPAGTASAVNGGRRASAHSLSRCCRRKRTRH